MWLKFPGSIPSGPSSYVGLCEYENILLDRSTLKMQVFSPHHGIFL